MNASSLPITPVDRDPVLSKIERAHVDIMKNKYTAQYCGAIFLGTTRIEDDAKKCRTAYTDGRNKVYGRDFVEKLSMAETIGLVLHENLHVMLLHVSRFNKKNIANFDMRLMNAACDYVINAIIKHIEELTGGWCKLPEKGLYHPKFKGWAAIEVYHFLSKGRDKGKLLPVTFNPDGTVTVGGETYDVETIDDHDAMTGDASPDLTDAEAKVLEEDVTDAIAQGKIIAGKMGVKTARAIGDAIAPKVDWKREMDEFVAEATNGRSEFTWRRVNRKRMAEDLILPGLQDITMGELIVAIDTSGSIGQQQLSVVAAHLADICEQRQPSAVRVLWWDTEVHGEQVFTVQEYKNIRALLKPQGGGGTHVGCVAKFIEKQGIHAQAIVVFTDGYVEDNIKWNIDIPTLWLIDGDDSFTPPNDGRKVTYTGETK
jgi:hypothetical protein